MRIADLGGAGEALLERLAALSLAAARPVFPGWLVTVDDARETLAEATAAYGRVLFDDDDVPVGWGACAHDYGAVWEIHPLIVDADRHRRGYGRLLARDLERHAAACGAGVLVVGTADETGATSLSGRDLYGDVAGALRDFRADPSHPVGFWMRLGYRLVGVTPDAEGPGLPSILLAKTPTS